MKIKVTRAKENDLDEILVLQKECYLQEAKIYNDYQIKPLLQTLDSIKADFKQMRFLVALVDGLILGSVRAKMKNETCHIGRLIVHKSYQNKGIGKQLMASIEAEFPMAKRYELFTGQKSVKNLYFYQNLGYSEFRKQKINENLTLIFMEKNFKMAIEPLWS